MKKGNARTRDVLEKSSTTKGSTTTTTTTMLTLEREPEDDLGPSYFALSEYMPFVANNSTGDTFRERAVWNMNETRRAPKGKKTVYEQLSGWLIRSQEEHRLLGAQRAFWSSGNQTLRRPGLTNNGPNFYGKYQRQPMMTDDVLTSVSLHATGQFALLAYLHPLPLPPTRPYARYLNTNGKNNTNSSQKGPRHCFERRTVLIKFGKENEGTTVTGKGMASSISLPPADNSDTSNILGTSPGKYGTLPTTGVRSLGPLGGVTR